MLSLMVLQRVSRRFRTAGQFAHSIRVKSRRLHQLELLTDEIVIRIEQVLSFWTVHTHLRRLLRQPGLAARLPGARHGGSAKGQECVPFTLYSGASRVKFSLFLAMPWILSGEPISPIRPFPSVAASPVSTCVLIKW